MLTDDHGLEIAGRETTEYDFPQRKITGLIRFVISESALFRAAK
jgi:hypothetical protein